MSIELTSDDQAYVEHLVQQGRYASVDVALKQGVEQLRALELDNDRIRALVEEGLESARQGRLVSEEQLRYRLTERRRKRA